MENKIYHCIFCGRHGCVKRFTVEITTETHKPIHILACPVCREYKGVEVCDPETCECWTLDVVRKMMAVACGGIPHNPMAKENDAASS